ncbi:MAG: hypothetical protein HY393_01490 [Candidatus Diapherotrites archaeon]|nr:hypothetical protein [Candidatus Diapherotrites archaeon]
MNAMIEGFKTRLKWLGSREFFFVALVFLLAFSIRGHLLRYELFFEFDSYWHARMVSYVLQNGWVPVRDPLAYYQLGGAPIDTVNYLFWIASTFMYKVFTLGAMYNKQLWIEFVKFLPAFYGALISVVAYFLGKEWFGKKMGVAAGLMAGLMAASIPAFVYRTMAGFFEDDSFGFLWLALGYYFFIKAVNGTPSLDRARMVHAGLAGIMFGAMAASWDGYFLVVLTMLPFLLFAFVKLWGEHGLKTAKHFAGLWVISMLVFSAITTLVRGTQWLNTVISILTFGTTLPLALIAFGIVGLIVIGGALFMVFERQQSSASHKGLRLAGLAFMYLFVVALVYFSGTYQARANTVTGLSVGEENIGSQFFGNKYSFLAWVPFVVLLITPWIVFRKKDGHTLALLHAWTGVSLFMAWQKLKWTFLLGLPLGIGLAFLCVEAFAFFRNRSGLERKVVGVAGAFFLLMGVAAGMFFVTQNTPNIEMSNGWKEVLPWVSDNLPEGARMFNWWDEGHWISFLGERAVYLDNRNYDSNGNSQYGLFALNEDEESAYQAPKNVGANYWIVGNDQLGRLNSFALYGYNVTNYNDPRVSAYVGIAMPCSKSTNNLTGETSYACAGNVLNEQQMLNLPVGWGTIPNQLIDNRIPMFAYREKDHSSIYLFNVPANKSLLVRAWFGDPTLRHFKEIHQEKGVKVFQLVD